jgi:hypothetical protein|tara:strand:- start:303 stop:506 length:204 start_codon:yes stop_codon:yes gene_type:complete
MKNATQDANKSFDQQLIDIIKQQNDFIFNTRKRLFALEHKHKLNTVLFSGLIAIIYIMTIALVVSHG